MQDKEKLTGLLGDALVSTSLCSHAACVGAQVVLLKLSGADPDGRRHCIKLLRTFEYRGHLCLAFEAMVGAPCY